tara:strand:+ start:252 stop:509 length:258 start_codon:yes stop_codon:yes gene_type:complete
MTTNIESATEQGEPNFEEALNRLEDIVEKMESGDAPLSSLVDHFEEGSKLLKICRQRLEEAELKIKSVRKEQGKFITESLSEEAE